jgi:dTMP kinase
MTDNPDGCFIVFEGIDGAGTTTQAERYAAYLRQKKRIVHVTHEPSDGPIGTQLRLALSGRVQVGTAHQAHCMALMFAADRLDHLDHEILPHMRDGSVVICDRYDLSSIAYQTATAPEKGKEQFEPWVRRLNQYAVRPTVTVVLDVDPEEAERRRRLRTGALELYEQLPLQRQLAELYRNADKLLPEERFIRVDGNQPLEDVTTAVREALAPIVA